MGHSCKQVWVPLQNEPHGEAKAKAHVWLCCHSSCICSSTTSNALAQTRKVMARSEAAEIGDKLRWPRPAFTYAGIDSLLGRKGEDTRGHPGQVTSAPVASNRHRTDAGGLGE
mmetsp:Transcript_71155/g.141087  ORF Transcript_71155/g.141087 Transcript_71155/m.141087 type:complete len:113 (-) Transcript_71155:502-840(-)